MNSSPSQAGRNVLRDLLLLTVLISLLFGVMLGNRPLSVPDEGRYVEIPREMVSTGDYLTPRLNGVKYFEKPVLFYWLESASIRLFGLHEFTLRLWPALFALFGCFGVYGAGRRLYNRETGIFAAVVLCTSLLYYALSRVIILDMPVSVLITLALLSFLVGTREQPGVKRRLFFWSFYCFSALAVLTKGLIGMVIPGMVIGAWILVLGEWRLLRTIYLPSGLFLLLVIAAPWHILVNRANPEFFHFYFIHEHIERYLTKVHNRYEPFWFFLPVVLGGLFPWTPFLVQAVAHSAPFSWKKRHDHRDALFLMLWAVLVLLFFSASDSKLIPYILPVFPPLAILIGRYLAEGWKKGTVPGLIPGYVLLGFFCVVLIIALFSVPHFRPEIDSTGLHRTFDLLALVLAAGTMTVWALARWKNFRSAVSAIALTMTVFLVLADSTGPKLDARSVKDLALELKQRLKPDDAIVNYRHYYQDLPVYLERRITLVDWKGELEFGTSVEDTSGWIIDNDAFWKLWNGPKTVYLFTRRSNYDELVKDNAKNMHMIDGNERNVLLSNRERGS